jgi:hypothetical protein
LGTGEQVAGFKKRSQDAGRGLGGRFRFHKLPILLERVNHHAPFRQPSQSGDAGPAWPWVPWPDSRSARMRNHAIARRHPTLAPSFPHPTTVPFLPAATLTMHITNSDSIARSIVAAIEQWARIEVANLPSGIHEDGIQAFDAISPSDSTPELGDGCRGSW